MVWRHGGVPPAKVGSPVDSWRLRRRRPRDSSVSQAADPKRRLLSNAGNSRCAVFVPRPMNEHEPIRYALSVDHLVLAGPDLETAVATVEAALGVVLEPGGAHPGLGTRNRLLGLGSGVYLEVIGPDPDQPEPTVPRAFGIDGLDRPTLVTWALRIDDPSSAPATAEPPAGYEAFRAMSRRRPDGSTLSWRLAFPSETAAIAGPIHPAPFLIDWNGSRPPGRSLPAAATLEGLHLSGPAEVAAALHVAARSTRQPVDDPAVEVLVSPGEPVVEAVLRVAGRRLVWKGAI